MSELRRAILPAAWTALAAGVTLTQPAPGAGDWYVDVGDPGCGSGAGGAQDPFCRISDAIAVAAGGDVVHIAAGTYFEHLVLDRPLTLIGTEGRDLTVVDGGASGRVVTVGDGVEAEIDGLTITHGMHPTAGGGVSVGVGGASLVLTNSAVVDNTAGVVDFVQGHGGGIHSHGRLHLVDSLVEGNLAAVEGGGIWLGAASATLVRCVVGANRSGGPQTPYVMRGGGLFAAAGSTLQLIDSQVEGNEAVGAGFVHGGGIFNEGDLTLAHSAITGNRATGAPAHGGGIENRGSVVAARATVADNRAEGPGASSGYGAGVASWGSAALTSCELRGNVALGPSKEGGGVLCLDGSVALTHCTVVSNYPDGVRGRGAGLGGATIEGSILWDNWPAQIVGDPQVSYSDVEGGWPGVGNLDADPQFVDADQGDHRLGALSPCIDRGDPASVPTGRDRTGNPRLLDGELDRRLVVDMGAHEFDHVQLEVHGTPTYGGSLSFETTGTAGMRVFLFVGLAPGEVLLPPYGALFLDLGGWWDFLPFGTIPDTRALTVPPGSGTVDVVLQELAVLGRPGNFSNPVTLTIE